MGLALKARAPRAARWALLRGTGFLHFLLDLPMHPHDLALWPGSKIHIGLALWHTPYWWWVELAFVVVACGYYAMRARSLGTFGGHALWASAIVVALHLFNSPWFSPTH